MTSEDLPETGSGTHDATMTGTEARKRAQAEVDDWCRSEDCRYRDWRSGLVPTHRLGADCPTPVAASQVQGAAEVGADVEALALILAEHEPVLGVSSFGASIVGCTCLSARDYRAVGFKAGQAGWREHLAAAVPAAGWVPPERVAEARAEELRSAANLLDSRRSVKGIASRALDPGVAMAVATLNDLADRIAERGDSS